MRPAGALYREGASLSCLIRPQKLSHWRLTQRSADNHRQVLGHVERIIPALKALVATSPLVFNYVYCLSGPPSQARR
jgi:hypothetical protein